MIGGGEYFDAHLSSSSSNISTGSAFWVLLYGVVYWASRLSLDSFSSAILYMGYLLLIALLVFLVTGGYFVQIWYPLTNPSIGTIGFLASYWAVLRLYSAIRVD